MQIEDGKTSSNIFAGCVDFSWLKEFASNFAKNVWGKVVDFAGGIADLIRPIPIVENITKFLKIDRLIQGAKSAAKKAVEKTYGTIVFIGGALGPCGKLIGATLLGGAIGYGLFVGGAALAGGIASLGLAGTAAFAFSAGLLLRFLVGGTRAIYNFNWNVTDPEIQQAQKNQLNNFYAVAGSGLGEALGNLVCGVGGTVAASHFKLNPTQIARTKELFRISKGAEGIQASGEFLEEIIESIWPVVSTATRAATINLFLEAYKNVRKWIKASLKKPGIAKIVPKSLENMVEAWGSEESKPWSFASAIEERIEKINPPGLQAFVENFYEESLESCADAVISISYA